MNHLEGNKRDLSVVYHAIQNAGLHHFYSNLLKVVVDSLVDIKNGTKKPLNELKEEFAQ